MHVVRYPLTSPSDVYITPRVSMFTLTFSDSEPMTTQSPVKPGTCPWRVWGRRSCKVDTDCPGAEKCCRNNWNRTNMCVRPR